MFRNVVHILILCVLISYPSTGLAASNTVETGTWSCANGEVSRIDNSLGTVTCVPSSLFYRGAVSPSGAFTYNGETGASCTGDVCRGGTCSGTAPNGVCTLSLNKSGLPFKISANQSLVGTPDVTANHMAEYHYTSFSLSGGTLTVGSPGANDYGAGLAIYVDGNVSITGGTIDLKGLGAQANTAVNGITCAPGQSGKGGNLTVWGGGSGGLSTAGSENGTSAPNSSAPTSLFMAMAYFLLPYPHVGGAGGSAPAQTGNVLTDVLGASYGAGGGGSGGCVDPCSGTIGAAGNGGGAVKILAHGTYSCSNATIDVSGTNAAVNGSGGGGGGGTILILADTVGTDTCTYVVSGGTGATSGPTNCGTGGNGGNGWYAVFDLPY